MPLHLNLAALTDEEVQALLGPDQALARLPDLTRARLAARPLPGPPVQESLTLEPAPERDWGATPEQARALAAASAGLLGAGAEEHGVFLMSTVQGRSYVRAFTLEGVTALLRWTEQPGAGRAEPPALLLLTLLRDRASGLSGVLTSSAALPPVPAPSEELDFALHPAVPAPALLVLHRARAARHGRAARLTPERDWSWAWQVAHRLNLSAWQRRGLLTDAAPA